MRRLLTAIGATMLCLLALPAAATTTGDKHVGSFYNSNYLGDHYAFSSWVQSSYRTPHEDELNLVSTTGPLSPGLCVQIAFDYEASGHYDTRIVRNCDPNSTRRTPLDYAEDTCGITPCDMPAKSVQIAIYDQDGGQLSSKTCWIAASANRTCGGWDPADGVNCSRIWGRQRDGDNWYRSGGDPRDCGS